LVGQLGVWRHVMSVSDPAFADDGNGMPLFAEATRLRERFPDARIVGRVEVHCGAEHTEDLVWLPDGTMFHACGWPGDEPFVVTGDPQAVMSALGITEEVLEELDVYFDLDDDPNQNDWGALATARGRGPVGKGRPGRLVTSGAAQRACDQPHGKPLLRRLSSSQHPANCRWLTCRHARVRLLARWGTGLGCTSGAYMSRGPIRAAPIPSRPHS
ncbi:DUF6333 family protein, partial [Streptomyces mirabilis]